MSILCQSSWSANEIPNLVNLLNTAPLIYRIKDESLNLYLLAERADQAIHVGSRWLWNKDTDSHCTASVQNATMAVVAVFHAVYLE